jgi:small multidrug resistance pump
MESVWLAYGNRMDGGGARMTAGSYLWLGAAMTVFLAASATLRRYVDVPQLWILIFALVLYTLGNLMMVRLMREGGLAVAISVSAVLQLLMASLVAMAVFGERPTPTQLAGIALGAVAVLLILSPWKGSGG